MKLVIKSKGFSQSLLGDGWVWYLTMQAAIGKLPINFATLTEIEPANIPDNVPPAQMNGSDSSVQIDI